MMDFEVRDLARRQAEICRLFGNPTRVLILWALRHGEMNVTDIAANVDASLQNTSQHLRLMRDRGVLAASRQGNSVLYSLRDHEVMRGCRLLAMAARAKPKETIGSIEKNPIKDREAQI